MVTPPFMGGFPPFTSVIQPPRQSEYDSQSFLFNNFAVFADAPNSAPVPPSFQGTLYLADRGTDGWRTSSPMPPLRFEVDFFPFLARSTVIPSADNSTLAWRMRDTGEAESRMSLYLREGSEPFQLVGPITDKPGPTPPSSEEPLQLGIYAAADLSRIPLRTVRGANEWLWEGDTTSEGRPTLYEYDLSEPGVGSTASEPKLVGVKNEGRLVSNAEAELISECGIVLGGGPPPSSRIDRSISENGKYLFFTAQHDPFGECLGEQPLLNEIYARIDGEHTVAISNPSAQDCAVCLQGTQRQEAEEAIANTFKEAIFQGASKDGTKVFFTSFQELFEGYFGSGTNKPHLYRYDFEAPPGEKLELISRPLAPETGSVEMSNPPNNYTGISSDGERAYFVAKKVLAKNKSAAYDSVTEGNQIAEATKFNLYVWTAPKEGNEAQVKFIAQLPVAPTATNQPITTPDGRFLLFSSTARLVESNTSTVAQLFEYDAVSGALVRVSVGDQGFNDNGNTAVNAPERPFVSSDGRRVFFQSSNALAPGAFNDPTDKFKNLYEWTWSGDHPTEAGARVFPILPSPAQNGESSSAELKGIDPAGENVYFTTIAKLVPQHVSGQLAIYTARVNGGFPGLAEEQGCDGDACQGVPSSTPGSTPLSSAALFGAGNVNHQRKATRRRCSGGKRKARKAGNPGRCAPKQSKRNRQTKNNRRAGR
jgi:hypothetical protein